jgi:hypothetical protein
MNASASELEFIPDANPCGTIYVPDVVVGAQRRLARAWLWLGLFALIGSGLFAILLVISRTPGVQNLFPVADFFRLALVVHVDLSVLVWFVAMAGMLWSLHVRVVAMPLAKAALAACALGTAGMLVAPFAGGGEALMANYIPVLDGRVFLGVAGRVRRAVQRCWCCTRCSAAPRPGRSAAAQSVRSSSAATPAWWRWRSPCSRSPGRGG